MSPSDLDGVVAVNGPGSRPAGSRPRLSRVCLFTGLTGLTSMLFLAGWTDSQPPTGAADVFGTAVAAALLTVSAVFGVAWLWPSPAASGRQQGPSGSR
jgi:hypothetical protein